MLLVKEGWEGFVGSEKEFQVCYCIEEKKKANGKKQGKTIFNATGNSHQNSELFLLL